MNSSEALRAMKSGATVKMVGLGSIFELSASGLIVECSYVQSVWALAALVPDVWVEMYFGARFEIESEAGDTAEFANVLRELAEGHEATEESTECQSKRGETSFTIRWKGCWYRVGVRANGREPT